MSVLEASLILLAALMLQVFAVAYRWSRSLIERQGDEELPTARLVQGPGGGNSQNVAGELDWVRSLQAGILALGITGFCLSGLAALGLVGFYLLA